MGTSQQGQEGFAKEMVSNAIEAGSSLGQQDAAHPCEFIPLASCQILPKLFQMIEFQTLQGHEAGDSRNIEVEDFAVQKQNDLIRTPGTIDPWMHDIYMSSWELHKRFR